MKLKEVIDELGLELRGDFKALDAEVKKGYVSDLLSDVLANSDESDLWVTLQIHPNIVAVAGIKGLPGIAIINGREPEEDTIKKAEEENIPLMVSKLTAYELAGRLYALTGSGNKNGTD